MMVVKAFVMVDGQKQYVKKSLAAHCYTSGGNKKFTNPKSVKVKIKKKKAKKKAKKTVKVSLKAGKKARIKATIKKLKKSKKLPNKGHGRKLRYISTNKQVAIVKKSGKIKAKAAGSCKIYVLAVNGVRATVKVTVK